MVQHATDRKNNLNGVHCQKNFHVGFLLKSLLTLARTDREKEMSYSSQGS